MSDVVMDGVTLRVGDRLLVADVDGEGDGLGELDCDGEPVVEGLCVELGVSVPDGVPDPEPVTCWLGVEDTLAVAVPLPLCVRVGVKDCDAVFD